MSSLIKRIGSFLHLHMLGFLLIAYAGAALVPAPGASMRTVRWAGFSLPQIMLAVLLFNAGAGISIAHLRGGAKKLWLVGAGLLANAAVPLTYLFGLTLLAVWWPEADEVQIILIGLLISAAMPIAGSSTTWAQNVGGSPVLSLGLVLASTLISPILTPLTFRAAATFVDAGSIGVLAGLKDESSFVFLASTIVLPSVLGISFRASVSDGLWARIHPHLRLVNLINLLVLNYSNAASALPRAFRQPDWDFLFLIVVIVGLQCALAFWIGWVIANRAGASAGDRTALMYGLGMTNNGTGLVLANTHLPALPLVALPLIFANLTQQIIAGFVNRWLRRRAGGAETAAT